MIYVIQGKLMADPDAPWVDLLHPNGLPKESPDWEDLEIYRFFRWRQLQEQT